MPLKDTLPCRRLFFAIAFALSLAGCGSRPDESNRQPNSSPATSLSQKAHPYSEQILSSIDQIVAEPHGFSRLEGLVRLAATRTTTELPEILERLAILPDNEDRYELERVVYLRWASEAPDAAFIRANSSKTNSYRFQLLRLITRVWASMDANAARNAIVRLKDHELRPLLLAQTYKTGGAIDLRNALSFLEDNQSRQSAIDGIIREMARLDPLQAIRRAQEELVGGELSAALDAAITEWANNDPQAAANYVTDLTPGHKRSNLASSVIYPFCIADPYAAFDWAIRLGAGQSDLHCVSTALEHIAKRSVSDALALARSMPESDAKSQAFAGIIEQWTRESPADATKWIQSNLDGEPKVNALRRAIYTWARNDLYGAASFVEDLPAGKARAEMIDSLLYEYSQNDPLEAARWIERVAYGEKRDQLIARSLELAINHDPTSAIPAIDAMIARNQSPELARRVAQSLAQKDINQALSWSQSLQDPEERSTALRAATESWVRVDATAAAAYWSDLPEDSPDKNNLFHAIVDQYGKQNLSSALQWAQSLESDQYVTAINAFTRQWARTQPMDAAEFANSIDDPGLRNNLHQSIASTWSNQDPLAAATWAESLPEDSSKNRIVQSIVSNWVKHDTLSATVWLEMQPSGPSRDAGAETIVNRIAYDSAQEAFDLTAMIQDSDMRFRSARKVIYEIFPQNPDQARQALISGQLNLNADQTQRILDTIDSKD